MSENLLIQFCFSGFRGVGFMGFVERSLPSHAWASARVQNKVYRVEGFNIESFCNYSYIIPYSS